MLKIKNETTGVVSVSAHGKPSIQILVGSSHNISEKEYKQYEKSVKALMSIKAVSLEKLSQVLEKPAVQAAPVQKEAVAAVAKESQKEVSVAKESVAKELKQEEKESKK